MNIAAITPCSLLDYPGILSCILFTQGCNMRCGYCHNPEMVMPQRAPALIPWESILHFLGKRRGLLEGVVFCGGEPTLQQDLVEVIIQVRSLGFKIKLDTNGSRPEVLSRLLNMGLLDYVAMDYKTSSDRMDSLCKGSRFTKAIHTSLKILQQSDIPFEIRTTVLKEHHPREVLQSMAQDLEGAPLWYLQSFRPDCTLDPAMVHCHPYSKQELQSLAEELKDTSGIETILRG